MSQQTYEDALKYANYKNTITDINMLDDIDRYLGRKYNFTIDKAGKLNQLDQVLDQTQIKRACCLGQTSVPVRIPMPTGVVIDDIQGTGQLMQEYQYYDKPVYMGKCPLAQYDKKNASSDTSIYDNCEEFYKVYCQNLIENFKEQNGGRWDLDKFLKYKPECACFVPKPPGIPDNINIVPACFYDGCTLGNPYIWLDRESRSGECDLTICQVNLNNVDFEAGGGVSVRNNIEQRCGDQNTKPPSGSPPAAPGWQPADPPTAPPIPGFTPGTVPSVDMSNLGSFESIIQSISDILGMGRIMSLAVIVCAFMMMFFFVVMIIIVKKKKKSRDY